ncbi:hypothetical protein MYX64_06335 [Nitrospinae bacterium AH_259_B05_G02_I21]|nr:hypothetical protein [Nitrospinae bacterium AH_259_B05_G02_I21]
MKTLTAPATAQSLMRGIDARCLVTIAFADGLTLRVSDQSILSAPDGNHYLGLLRALPEVAGGFDDIEKSNEPRELTLSLANTRRVDAYARFSDLLHAHEIAFATVTVKWWLKGADASGDLITDFVGEAEGATSITADAVAVQVSGIEFSQRSPLNLYKINEADFPNADPSAVGRVCGPAIGVVENVPVWPVDAGARDVLREFITSVETGTLKLSDASRFPSSGTVIIGSEEIAYTGKSNNDLTTLTRGSGGSAAAFHNRGAAALEKKSTYTYLGPTFPMESVSAVKVAGVLAGAGEYTLDLVDTVLLSGRSVVSLKLNVPAIIERHQHESAETTDQEKPGTTGGHACFQNKGNAIDGAINDTSTYAQASRSLCGVLPVGTYADLNLSNWSLTNLGEVIAATYFCNYSYEETNYIVGKNDAYIDGILLSSAGVSTRQLSWGAPLSWSALLRTVTCKIHPDTGDGLRIYDLWLDVTYVVTLAGAPAGADAAVRVPVTIDGKGVYDLAECTGLTDGEITGTDRTVLERPDHAVEFVQRVLAGRTAAEIDSTSYSASGTTYATKGWKCAGMLNREWGAAELLARLAAEASSDQFWEAGSHRLLYDDPSPTSDVTIEDRDLISEPECALTERDEIANIVEAHFSRNYDAGLNTDRQEAFEGVAKKEDATSKTSFGNRPLAAQLEFVRVQAHADDVAQRLIDKRKEPRLLARVPLAWTKAAALERGDIIDLDIDLLATLSPRPLFKVVSITRSFQSEAWEVAALEVK